MPRGEEQPRRDPSRALQTRPASRPRTVGRSAASVLANGSGHRGASAPDDGLPFAGDADFTPRSPLRSSEPSGSTVTVGEFFGLLRRRLGTLILVVVLGLVAAFALLSTVTKVFQAQSAVKVAPVAAIGDTGAAKDISTITESQIVTSTAVGQLAAKTLGYTDSISSLLKRITVSSPLNSQLIYITYASSTADRAASGANAFANAYLNYRRSVGNDALAQKAKTLNNQLGALRKQLGQLGPSSDANTKSALQSQINSLNRELNSLATTVIVPGQVVGVAQAPLSPSSPKKALYLAGGLLAGLVLGIAAAIVRDRRDDRVHGPGDLEHSVGAPVLATVPSSATSSRARQAPLASRPRDTVNPAEVDAYRAIATKLRTSVTGKGARSFLVLRGGAVKEELAAVNLAATFARQGLTAALVGTDTSLRHAQVLLDPGSPLVTRDGGLTPVPQFAGLRLLSLGDEGELDATLREGSSLIEDILSEVDVVLLDGVNLDLASSSLTLGRLTHAAVVVAVDGQTTHAELGRTVRELAQVGTSPLGGVLFVRRRRAGRRGTKVEVA